ncbi:Dynein heavy cytoplasmic [Brachionus plicatilis]|uniref:Dynein heavy cytoplasmic n=1 Tax=Brachionus plicatilis TaxID=10195 RepID=A0A3M7T5N8_BRAPC|nr:Dynein heavy cytoplasmic [Brachionus plicatilis]
MIMINHHKSSLKKSLNRYVLKHPKEYKYLADTFENPIKSLEQFLKLKFNFAKSFCLEFPRFYFVEKQKLIETLSHMRDCRKYLDCVKICFSGIRDLIYSLPKEVAPNEKPDSLALDIYGFLIFLKNLASDLEVTGLISRNGAEELKFFTALKSYSLQKPSEWFKNFSKILKSSVCKNLHSYMDILEEFSDYQFIPSMDKRLNELSQYPSQVVVLGESLTWCKHVSRIIEHKKIEEFKYILSYLNNSISKLSALQLTALEPNRREIFSKLILWLLYTKDLTSSLMEITNLNQFSYEWLRMLKYTFEKRVILKNNDETDPSVILYNKYENVQVNQLTSNIIYDFEFHDFSSQLVISPLTDKCFLNLTSAVASFRCGALIGPESSGKRQTLNLLAQFPTTFKLIQDCIGIGRIRNICFKNNCGQFLMQINCDRDLTSEVCERMLKGFVFSGCWIVFDRVDQLEKNVLSTVGFHLEYLRNSTKFLTEKDDTLNGILDPYMIRQRQLFLIF